MLKYPVKKSEMSHATSTQRQLLKMSKKNMSKASISYTINIKHGLLSNCFKIWRNETKHSFFDLNGREFMHGCNLGTHHFRILSHLEVESNLFFL